MLGFSPVSSEAAAAVSPELVPVNEKLREYEQAWDSYCAAWLVIQVQDYNWVQKWRLQVTDSTRMSLPECHRFSATVSFLVHADLGAGSRRKPQAEVAMRDRGLPAMTDEQARAPPTPLSPTHTLR